MTVKKIRYIIVAITLLYVMILLSKCESIASTSENYKVIVNPSEQPSKKLMDRDRKFIEQSFLNCVETYRIACLNDGIRNVYMPYGRYQFYAVRRFNNDNFDYIGSPLPTCRQIKVFTDTILYDNSKKFCFAIIIVKRQFSYFKGLEREPVRFDGMALIGYRTNINKPFKIYPQDTYSITEELSYKSCQASIRYLYFEQFKGQGVGYGYVINGQKFPNNIGDSEFFDRSPYFKKYDKTRYNFQMLTGQKGDFEFTFTGDSIMTDFNWEKQIPYFI